MTSKLQTQQPHMRLWRHSCIFAACLALTGGAHAAQLLLTQIPAGSGGKEPPPNVIITVDDSGSMGEAVSSTDSTSKMTLLKSALRATFGDGTSNSGKIADGRIRLAFQTMHDNGSFIASNGATSIKMGATNSMKSFTGTHRTNFESFISKLSASGGTPSLLMMKNVATYMNAPANKDNPWTTNPGSSTQEYLACRRAYHVFLTDGAWKDQSTTDRTSNGDGVTQTLGDGTTAYNPTNPQVKVYKDAYGDNTSYASTFSDFAFSNWARDLQNGATGTSQKNSSGTTISGNTAAMANGVQGVRPLIRKSGSEVFATTTCTNANNCITTQEFWNPRNDPATWQHLTQYTIGFGTGAVNWPSTATTPKDWDTVASGGGGNSTSTDPNFSGDFAALVQGEVSWDDMLVSNTAEKAIRTSELWHGALNGRGKFYPAKSSADLVNAFAEILDTVIADTDRSFVSIATGSSRLQSGTKVYIAGYKADRYSGSLSSRPLDAETGATLATEDWSADGLLDARNLTSSPRVILSYSGTAGINWGSYSTLPAAQQTKMNQNSLGAVDNKGTDRVNYLRGDRTKELRETSGVFRDRDSRLGDIVNSNIWFTGRPSSGYFNNGYSSFATTASGGMGGRTPVLYLGANDGMLHGFNANTGAEIIAYIPQGIAEGNLRKLSDTNYTHQYYVDGSPFSGDAFIGTTPAWKTVLTGTLGAGGKGYFLLDVTDPSTFTTANAASIVMMDTTATTDADIGYIFTQPVIDEAITNKSKQIVKMNNGRWAVLLGNGYNSTNEAPVLLIQYLDGLKELKKVSPCGLPTSGACTFKGTNGLSGPQPVDLNGDGKVDLVYAGDLKGNVWKFDLTSSSDSNWKASSFGDSGSPNGKPLFIAKQGGVQAIVAAPFVAPHPSGGVMVVVGTGRNLTDSDQSDSSVQSLYGVRDSMSYTVTSGVISITEGLPINTTSDTGVPTSLVEQTRDPAVIENNNNNYYGSSSNPVDYSVKSGWYLNLPLSAERMIQNISPFVGSLIFVRTMIPKVAAAETTTVETCSPSPTQERSFVTVIDMFSGAAPTFAVFGVDNANTSETNSTDSVLMDTVNATRKIMPSADCPVGQVCTNDPIKVPTTTGATANWREIK